jgi:translation initiation factor IF-3
MDYGKFKYAEQKKAAEAKSKQKVRSKSNSGPALTMATTTSSCARIKRFGRRQVQDNASFQVVKSHTRTRFAGTVRDECDLILVEQFPQAKVDKWS